MNDETFVRLTRQIKELRASLERLNTRDGNRSAKRKALHIFLGAITVTNSFHGLIPETGVSDDLATINALSTGYLLILRVENSGDTITVKDSVGNIKLLAGDFVMSNQHAILSLIYDADLSLWLELSRRS